MYDKRTKIVATIGPASEKKETLSAMIKAGMNVARLNFSHGEHDWHAKVIKTIRNLSEELKSPVGIMADLQGPRIRVGNFEEFSVKNGDIIFISDRKSGRSNELVIDSDGVCSYLKKGERILIEDGLIEIKVTEKKQNIIKGEVISGGEIKPRKGINFPDTDLRLDAVTKKDEKDLRFALAHNVDFVALSFVSNAKEIKALKNKIKKITGKSKDLPMIIAKIERKEAIKNIDEIIKAVDGIMVARGDLGIEMDESKVVLYQKEIIAKCLREAKPVIVATQMLDSMIKNPIPTRAEVSDVSNAVIDHTDAVMLSGESANGKYPVKTVETMSKIIRDTEESPFDDLEHGFLSDSSSSVSAAVANSTHELAKNSGAKAIVVASLSGFTARMIARHRPQQEIFVMTNNRRTYFNLALLWGTESSILPDCETLDELINKSVEILKKKKLLKEKDKIIIVTGRPHVKKEHMSLVKVEEIH
jgi:pyruvate kinase